MGVRLAVCALVLAALCPLRALGQCKFDPAADRIEPSLQGLAKGSFEKLLAGDKASVAAAEQIFSLTTSANVKQRIASILLHIGVRKPPYFEYLSDCARRAIEDPTPWPIAYDKRGKRTGQVSRAFEQWCRKRHCDPNTAEQDTVYFAATPVLYLAASGDPRAYDLLVRGVHSHNYTIAMTSGMGLARLQNPQGIHQIITAAEAVPAEDRGGVAMGLIFFSDERAQAAADRLIDDKEWLAAMRQQAKLKGTTEFFGY